MWSQDPPHMQAHSVVPRNGLWEPIPSEHCTHGCWAGSPCKSHSVRQGRVSLSIPAYPGASCVYRAQTT